MSMLDDLIILYDGDCPFCNAYVKIVRLRDVFGHVHLINARERPEYVRELKEAGFSIDEGMAVKYKGRWIHGDECIHFLALSSTRSGLLNGLFARLFSSKRLSALLYPIMRAGRNVVLKLLGRKKIGG